MLAFQLGMQFATFLGHLQNLILSTALCCASMEERFTYYFRVYTLAFQLGMKLAVRCEGFRHIIAISAPGCNITYSPFIWLDDRGQASHNGQLQQISCLAR